MAGLRVPLADATPATLPSPAYGSRPSGWLGLLSYDSFIRYSKTGLSRAFSTHYRSLLPKGIGLEHVTIEVHKLDQLASDHTDVVR